MERADILFGKGGVKTAKGKKKEQMPFGEVFGEEVSPDPVIDLKEYTSGKTMLDIVHQSMLLHAAGKSELLKIFLMEHSKNSKFWTLAQAFAALYPVGTDERRWVEAVWQGRKHWGCEMENKWLFLQKLYEIDSYGSTYYDGFSIGIELSIPEKEVIEIIRYLSRNDFICTLGDNWDQLGRYDILLSNKGVDYIENIQKESINKENENNRKDAPICFISHISSDGTIASALQLYLLYGKGLTFSDLLEPLKNLQAHPLGDLDCMNFIIQKIEEQTGLKSGDLIIESLPEWKIIQTTQET